MATFFLTGIKLQECGRVSGGMIPRDLVDAWSVWSGHLCQQPDANGLMTNGVVVAFSVFAATHARQILSWWWAMPQISPGLCCHESPGARQQLDPLVRNIVGRSALERRGD
jgi:hypothetical protein